MFQEAQIVISIKQRLEKDLFSLTKRGDIVLRSTNLFLASNIKQTMEVKMVSSIQFLGGP
jgi:hypothetical protein